MSKSIKKPKKTNEKSLSFRENPPKGQAVYTASLKIGTSKSILEIFNPESNSSVYEFGQTSEDIEDLISTLNREAVKGVQLQGKKNICRIIADKILKCGIRPLIADTEKQQNKKSNGSGIKGIPVIDEHVAGIDIGQSVIYVAVPPNLDKNHTRVFGTFTDELEAIVSWLKELNIKTVAMESTSIYWIPLFELCERAGIKPLIVNPKHVKMLPGRKSDVLDAQWLMRLLACGLLKGGFIPPQPFRALRDLARHRHDLTDRGGDSLNRVHKMLELMNIKLSCVVNDISGKSGLSIIRAIIQGIRDPYELAQLADKQCKRTVEEFKKALTGTFSEEHIFVMKQEMDIYEYFHNAVVGTELKIKELLEKLPDAPDLAPLPTRTKKRRNKKEYNRSPYCFDLRPLLYRKFGRDLTVVSGIEEASAAVILFETGGNFDSFPTLKHFASWCAVSPGCKISGGKMLSGKSPKKFSRVGQVFRIAANSNYKSQNATGAFMRKLTRNGKSGKAVRKATAHRICAYVWDIVKHGQEYSEKSAEAYEKQYEERKLMAMTKTLKSMGYEVVNIATGSMV